MTSRKFVDDEDRETVLQEQLELSGYKKVPDLNEKFYNEVTIGKRVSRSNAPKDIRGKYLGDGTFKNANKGFYNTKETVIITQDWANILQEKLSTLIKTAPLRTLLGLGEITKQGYGQYTSLSKYIDDPRARLNITSELFPKVPKVVLPGSTQCYALLAKGYSTGLVKVKNPMTSNGYVSIGSDKYIDIIKSYRANPVIGTLEIQHLLCQGALYGFGHVFYVYGYTDIKTTLHYGEAMLSMSVDDFVSAITNKAFLKALRSAHNNLVSPDKIRMGQYGAASLMLRHSDKLTGKNGNPITASSISRALKAGKLKQISHWDENYRSSSQRSGITAFPMRDMKGKPVSLEQSHREDSGYCTLDGSGPGITQHATRGGKLGGRFYKNERKHSSKKSGQRRASSTYSCGPTPDSSLNPWRQDFRKGGIHGGRTNLTDLLTGKQLDAQEKQYYDFLDNPAKYGANPSLLSPDDEPVRTYAPYNLSKRRQSMNAQDRTNDSFYWDNNPKQNRTDQLAKQFLKNDPSKKYSTTKKSSNKY